MLYANRFHVHCTLIILSYPFFSIGTAALLLAFGLYLILKSVSMVLTDFPGLLSAVWTANDPGVQGASALMLILPISMSVLFGVSCATAKAQSRLRKEGRL